MAMVGRASRDVISTGMVRVPVDRGSAEIAGGPQLISMFTCKAEAWA
jgi:hypothetical protein